MALLRRRHKHLPRKRDFWTDVENKYKNFNAFVFPEDENSNDGDDSTGNGDSTGTRGNTISSDHEDDTPASNQRRSHPSTLSANSRKARSTVVQIVYKTVTDDGNAPPTSTPSPLPPPSPSPSPTIQAAPGTTVAKAGAPVLMTPASSSATDAPSPSSLPSAIEQPLTASIETTLALASDVPTVAPSFPTSATANEASAEPTASASPTSISEKSTSDGTSGAAKAGIAIGVMAGALVVFLLVFFLFNRRKTQMQQQRLSDEDEKTSGSFGTDAAVAGGNDPRAPRISLRPVTQFLPNLNIDKRTSKGPAGNGNFAPASASLAPRTPGASPWERPLTGQDANAANPFGAHAERINAPIAEEPARSMSFDEKPLPTIVEPASASAEGPESASANGAAAAATAASATGALAAGAAGAAAGGLTRKASTRKDGPQALDLTLPASTPQSSVPISPSQHSAGSAAIAAAGGPANSTVHRVQLDFKPTLEDEMELRAGQLVRLLHEYDDGWALCIRLDRSQQGVVPRTCLSTRPVKPRPQNQGQPRGPPIGPGVPRGPGPNFQRPMTPQGGFNGAPPQSRPESPARPMTAPGRPASPGGKGAMGPGGRSQSPGPRFQGPPGQRPQSPGGPGGKLSPPGPSKIPRMNPNGPRAQGRPGPPMGPVGRKPVPGQAL